MGVHYVGGCDRSSALSTRASVSRDSSTVRVSLPPSFRSASRRRNAQAWRYYGAGGVVHDRATDIPARETVMHLLASSR